MLQVIKILRHVTAYTLQFSVRLQNTNQFLYRHAPPEESRLSSLP